MTVEKLSDLSRAQIVAMGTLSDGEWHFGGKSVAEGRVLGVPAVALVRLGLAERRGKSRTASPQNPGYEYRLTEAGKALLASLG